MPDGRGAGFGFDIIGAVGKINGDGIKDFLGIFFRAFLHHDGDGNFDSVFVPGFDFNFSILVAQVSGAIGRNVKLSLDGFGKFAEGGKATK